MNNKYLHEILKVKSRKEIIDFTGLDKGDLSKYINNKKPIPRSWELVFYLWYECENEGLNLNEYYNDPANVIGSHWLNK